MDKKRLLILGAAGFIGTNLTEWFVAQFDKYNIGTITHTKGNKLRIQSKYIYNIEADLTNKRDVQTIFGEFKPHIVIQAAAVTSNAKDILEQPYIHVTDNVIMNSLVFEEAFKNKVENCVFLSCSTMYNSDKQPQAEFMNTWLGPGNPYFGVASMKVFCENLCQFYAKLGKTKFTAIRHSNIYGPYDKFDLNKCHLVPAMIKKVIEPGEIQVIGGQGNEAKRDILYIDDLCDFINRCIEKQTNQYELLNCGYGRAFSVTEIINFIQEVAGTNKCILYDSSKKNIPTTTILDCSKARKLLDWVPITHIKDGLRFTIDYFKYEIFNNV